MSSKKPLFATTKKIVKEDINDMEIKTNVVDDNIPHPIEIKIKLTPSTKQKKHKHLKVKKINPSEMNRTKVYYWINQGH